MLGNYGQLDRVVVVFGETAGGELDLEHDGGVVFVGVVGAEGPQAVDGELLVGDRDAAFGRGAEDVEGAGGVMDISR